MRNKNADIMMNHIDEVPGLVEQLIAEKKDITSDFVRLFQTHDIKRIYLSGSGSPSNACAVLKYAATKLLGIETTWSYPSLFNNHEGFNVGGKYRPEEMMLICPAETGRTKGSVIAARNARQLGIPVVCTTLYPDGVLGRECDVVIQKPSGLEVALPSTKGHSMGVFLLLLCFTEAGYATGNIGDVEYISHCEALTSLPAALHSGRIQTEKWFYRYQKLVMNAPSYRFIAYGSNYGTAIEGALKFLECHTRPSYGYEMEEFMHGPLRAVHPGDMVFFLATEDGPEKERMFQLYEFTKQRTDACVLVQSDTDDFFEPLSLRFAAGNHPLFSAVEYLVPIQVLSSKISSYLGFDMTVPSSPSVGKAMQTSFTD